MMNRFNISIAILVLFLVSSCGVVSNTATTSVVKLEGSWNLYNENTLQTGTAEAPITLNFGENSISGFSGCNNYGAGFSQDKTNISFSKMAATKMACPNLNKEQNYLKLLEQVNRFEQKNEELLLFKGNILLLTFKR